MEKVNEGEQVFVEYLEKCSKATKDWKRGRCKTCNASCTIYCPNCCSISIPKEDWPDVVRKGKFHLPFAVDFILDDRRASSTGIQAASVLQAGTARSPPPCRIFERSKDSNFHLSDLIKEEGVFLLFPGTQSVPLSSVLESSSIKRLVVLDCKWTRSSVRLHPKIACLPKVHLDNAPKRSFYWRWHSAGEGNLCTVEALFFASWQASEQLGWPLEKRKDLSNIAWLFGIQREIIRREYEKDQGRLLPKHLPFSEDGKLHRRILRKRSPSLGM
jgi:hypothetical protein